MTQPVEHTENTPVTETFKYGVLVLALFVFIGCDQLTKELAKRELIYAPTSVHLLGLIRFEYAENPGSFMSIGAGLPEILRRWIHIASAFVVILGFFLLFSYAYRLDRLRLLGYSLLLAGACGNLVDRFNNEGRVIDFIVLRVGNLQTGVFNLADVFIMTGLAMILLRINRQHRARPGLKG
jgi:signal peptidase II